MFLRKIKNTLKHPSSKKNLINTTLKYFSTTIKNNEISSQEKIIKSAVDSGLQVDFSQYKVATVFGCTGHLGSFVCGKLAMDGYQVITPWRLDEMAIRDHKVMGDVGQIIAMRYHPDYPQTILDICSRSNIVVNCIGRDIDKLGDDSMEKSNIHVAEAIAKACTEVGVERFFHVSAAGASLNHESKFLRTKAESEERVKKAYPDVTIIRPNILFGQRDRFINFYSKAVRLAFGGPPLIKSGRARIQPVFAGDVACAISNAVKLNNSIGETYELAGPDIIKWNEVVRDLSKELNEEYDALDMPYYIGWGLGLLNEFTWRPTWTRDFVVRQTYDIYIDNPEEVKGFKELGLVPSKLSDHLKILASKWKKSSNYHLDFSRSDFFEK